MPAGLLLANLSVLFFSLVSGPDFLVWGWRIPFLLSLLLVVVGLWIRLGILETPTFQRLLHERRIEQQPVLQVLKQHPKEVILSSLARLSEQAPFYIFTAFVFTYATLTLGFSRDFVLVPVLIAAALGFVLIPFFGYLSDRLGRKPVYIAGAAVTGIYGFVYFGMLDSGVAALAFVAIAVSLVGHNMQYGPQAAMIAESFPAPLRYSGASLGYQLSSVFAGGPAPLIATALYATYKSGMAVAVYIAVCAVITIVATALMRERAGVDLDAEEATRSVEPERVTVHA